jgi:phospholipid/cholesterol/gamma-HCH transport system permease protein
MQLLSRPITALGRFFIWCLEFLGGLGYLLRDTAASIYAALFGTRGRRLGWQNLWAQMVRVGVRSIPIISLVIFCIGAILAFQMAPILDDYGALAQVADIIGIAMFRELGPLVAAIVLTGFAGASITAELGSMVVSEEIEALEAGAISPIRFLVVPRVLATTIMMVCLAVVADLVGTGGGMVISKFFLDVDVRQYLERVFAIVELKDFLTGLVKAAVFGTLISGQACYLGLTVTGGAEGVGNATTKTVVYTIVALITVDLMFTGVFYYLGL